MTKNRVIILSHVLFFSCLFSSVENVVSCASQNIFTIIWLNIPIEWLPIKEIKVTVVFYYNRLPWGHVNYRFLWIYITRWNPLLKDLNWQEALFRRLRWELSRLWPYPICYGSAIIAPGRWMWFVGGIRTLLHLACRTSKSCSLQTNRAEQYICVVTRWLLCQSRGRCCRHGILRL